jgi:hypothetical protein
MPAPAGPNTCGLSGTAPAPGIATTHHPSMADPMEHQTRERLRRRYRPRSVRVLFVGEAPPVSGRFFYAEDSGLFRAVREAFVSAFPETGNHSSFLEVFRGASCAFTDLCDRPVDHLRPAARRVRRDASESRLAAEIAATRPRALVTVVRAIEPNVRRAAARAEWEGELRVLPYPGRWVQARSRFVAALAPALRGWAASGLLPTGLNAPRPARSAARKGSR